VTVNHPSQVQVEALALLSEECGEVVQAVGKALRHGLDSYHPARPEDGDNSAQLARECGQVLAAIDIAIAAGIFGWKDAHESRIAKLANVGDYLHHNAFVTLTDATVRLRRAWRSDHELRDLGLATDTPEEGPA